MHRRRLSSIMLVQIFPWGVFYFLPTNCSSVFSSNDAGQGGAKRPDLRIPPSSSVVAAEQPEQIQQPLGPLAPPAEPIMLFCCVKGSIQPGEGGVLSVWSGFSATTRFL